MSDFVLNTQNKEITVSYGYRNKLSEITNYAKFLKKPLTLGMFVCCDKDGNVMIHPCEKGFLGSQEMQYDFYKKKYQEAKERVLFEGFSFNKKKEQIIFKNRTLTLKTFFAVNNCIGDLLFMDITLTPTAIKQIGI